jgi:hypothetical protein
MDELVPNGLREYFARRFASEVVSATRLSADSGGGGTTTRKVEGYGEPLLLTLERHDGRRWRCVFHTARPNEFGHDRRSDRAQQQLLAFDTSGSIPRQVAALDVGALWTDGKLTSLAGATELFLVTEWCEGTVYAADLRRLAHGEPLQPLDIERAHVLAAYLADLHVRLAPDPVRWRRALRDTIGSGEGIFGICDAYPDDTPHADAGRLQALEQQAVAWRWRLAPRAHRLTRTHGDFHPFNVVFRESSELSVLDCSRGGVGEAADDVAALALNYVFFASDHPERWRHCFSPLWHAFFRTYLELTEDRELLACLAPFLAWRALVVCCPKFYPGLSARARDTVLRLAEKALSGPRFEPDWADELFR